MTILNRLDSNWSRTERDRLNMNWSIIENYLSNLQEQIRLLTGGVDVQELINQINEILNQGNVIISDLETALQEATTVIANAQSATTDAKNAAQDALNAVNDIQSMIDNFGVKGIYDNNTIYSKNNSVYHEGSSYIYTNNTASKGNPPPNYPTVSNTYWQMIAAKGASGNGAVSKVNGKEPDGTGEVTLTPTDIGAVSSIEFNEHLEQIEQTTENHINDNTRHRVCVTQFGAKFDGVTDDTQAFNDAIDYLESLDGGELYLPAGITVISSKIIINQPIYIIGQGKGGNSDNTNGSGKGTTTIIWGSTEADTMFEFVSFLSQNTLFGGGMLRVMLDGKSSATRGFNLKSCGYTHFESIEGRNFIGELGLIDDSNGMLSQFNRFEDIKYVYGAGSLTKNSNGLVFYGLLEIGVTQNHIISISGLVNNGFLLMFKTSDNNVVDKCHGVAIGMGGTVYFANGIYSDSNVIQYLVGKVKSDSLARGNRIIHWNSEGGGLILAEGSVLHYEVYDYNHCDIFETHKYAMFDQKDLTLGDIDIVDGGAVRGVAAGQWACINLPDDVDSRISCIIPPNIRWANGNLQYIRLLYTQDMGNKGKKFKISINVLTSSDNTATHIPDFSNNNILIEANGQAYMNNSVTIPVMTQYSKGDSVFFNISRIGAHGDDTALGNLQITGAQLIYQSVGPDSDGSGIYPIGQNGA